MKEVRRQYLMWLVDKAFHQDDQEAHLELFSTAISNHICTRREGKALATFCTAHPRLEKQAWQSYGKALEHHLT